MSKLKTNHIFRIRFKYRNNAAYTMWTHSSIVGEIIRTELSREGVSLLGADLCEGDYLKQIPYSAHNSYRMGDIESHFVNVVGMSGCETAVYYQLTEMGAGMKGRDACTNTIECDVDLGGFLNEKPESYEVVGWQFKTKDCTEWTTANTKVGSKQYINTKECPEHEVRFLYAKV